MRQARNTLALALAFALLAGPALASPSVTLTASLTPERLGHPTTIGFGFDIAAPAGRVPPPLTELDIRYPGLGIGASGLGLETCAARTLEARGPAGCPSNSRMGYGSVLAEIPIGPEIVKENADVAIVRAPRQNGHTALLFYAEGITPVDAQIVFPASCSLRPHRSEDASI